MNGEFPDVEAGFRKGRGTRSNFQHPLNHQKSDNSRKNIYFCFTDYSKAFDCVYHNKLWTILQEMGLPDHITCLVRNRYADQEAQLEPDMEQWTDTNWERVH